MVFWWFVTTFGQGFGNTGSVFDRALTQHIFIIINIIQIDWKSKYRSEYLFKI